VSVPTDVLEVLRTAAGPMRTGEIRDALGQDGPLPPGLRRAVIEDTEASA
jgi:hypothetical protein